MTDRELFNCKPKNCKYVLGGAGLKIPKETRDLDSDIVGYILEDDTCLDVGWYPPFDWKSGQYIVTYHMNDFQTRIILETKDIYAVFKAIMEFDPQS